MTRQPSRGRVVVSMPIKRAAVRQLRKDRKRTLRNQAIRSELKTLKKRFDELLTTRRQDEARVLLPAIMKRFDQAASRGLIHRNTASRTKSTLMRHLTSGTPVAKPRATKAKVAHPAPQGGTGTPAPAAPLAPPAAPASPS